MKTQPECDITVVKLLMMMVCVGITTTSWSLQPKTSNFKDHSHGSYTHFSDTLTTHQNVTNVERSRSESNLFVLGPMEQKTFVLQYGSEVVAESDRMWGYFV